MSLLVLSAANVDTIASSLSVEDLQYTMAQLFARFSHLSSSDPGKGTESGISMPPRISIQTANHTALFMPARMGPPISSSSTSSSIGSDTIDGTIRPLGNTAIKVVSVPTQNSSDGLPGTTLVLDEATGSVKAVVNARKLTALRNAAGSLLSTSLVCKSRPASMVAFGAGQQIDAHLNLHLHHFPTITSCAVVNRTLNGRATSLRERMAAKFPLCDINLLSSDKQNVEVEKAVRSADLIICATSSTNPLFPSSWVKTGAHVILIGSYSPAMHEVDTPLIHRALRNVSTTVTEATSSRKENGDLPILLVDSREACLREAGELIDAHVQPTHITEIGEIIQTDGHGNVDRQSYLRSSFSRDGEVHGGFDGPISMFKSVGIGLQDVVIAHAVVEKALNWESGVLGTVVPDYDS